MTDTPRDRAVPKAQPEPEWMRLLGAIADDLWQRGDKTTSSSLHEVRALIVADRSAHDACRKRTAVAWSAFLSAALDRHLGDGIPILSVVLDLNPGLRRRLDVALAAPPREGQTHA